MTTTETQKTQINGIDDDPALRALLAKRMGAALAPLTVRPLRAEAVFVDDNGPKGGPALRSTRMFGRCGRRTVRAQRSAETPRLAFDAAFAILKRQLERYRERDRQNKRHPKKYFAATRAQATGRSRSARRARGA